MVDDSETLITLTSSGAYQSGADYSNGSLLPLSLNKILGWGGMGDWGVRNTLAYSSTELIIGVNSFHNIGTWGCIHNTS